MLCALKRIVLQADVDCVREFGSMEGFGRDIRTGLLEIPNHIHMEYGESVLYIDVYELHLNCVYGNETRFSFSLCIYTTDAS